MNISNKEYNRLSKYLFDAYNASLCIHIPLDELKPSALKTTNDMIAASFQSNYTPQESALRIVLYGVVGISSVQPDMKEELLSLVDGLVIHLYKTQAITPTFIQTMKVDDDYAMYFASIDTIQ